MKENQICYFIENDMVIFGAYSYKSTCTHQMLMTFTGWTLQTLLEKAEEVSDEEIEEL